MAKAKKRAKKSPASAKLAAKTLPAKPLYKVRKSSVHGNGCFATQFIPKGTRITEYLGDRITHKQADERYEGYDVNDNHTFLFIVDRKTVIDGGVGGNDARWINHSCAENCESTVEKGRVYIDAIKNIEKGAELGYDYQIGRDKSDPPNVDEIYACRCGAPNCRGTMLWPPKRPKPRKAKSKSKAKSRSSGKSAAATKRGKTAAKRGKKTARR
ncbi:MAG: SET domain-containing protein-lysine N-methyltransferase [Pseudomonadota bacterium]